MNIENENKKILIIDYGMGNIGSVKNMLKRIGCKDIIIGNSINEIRDADKYILPGVGSYDAGMRNLNGLGIKEQLITQVKENQKPILGICLGMQLLGMSSEEGLMEGLGLLPFNCVKFSFKDKILKVPHMGWNNVKIKKSNKITRGLTKDEERYYFVHSYYAVCENEDNEMMLCDYGGDFTAAVCGDNIYGVQFHPEKSHVFGLNLMKNFVEEC